MNPSELRDVLRSLLTAVFRCGMPAWISCVLCAAPGMAMADSVTLHAVADTRISTQSPTSNFGTAPDMVIGTQGPMAGTPRNRGLIKFDLTGQIPPSSEIKSVALTFTVAMVPLGGVNSMFELRRIRQQWNESEATWNNRITTGPWSSPGGAAPDDFSTTISAATLVGGLGSYTFGSTTNLIADVQAWLDEPGTNFGWIVVTQSEGAAKSARRVTAREGGANGPSLVIEYTVSQTQPPQMSSMSLLGDKVSFQFDADQQRAYTVEFNNAMDSTNWVTLTNIVAQPAPTNIKVSDSTTASQRFYRVKTQ